MFCLAFTETSPTPKSLLDLIRVPSLFPPPFVQSQIRCPPYVLIWNREGGIGGSEGVVTPDGVMWVTTGPETRVESQQGQSSEPGVRPTGYVPTILPRRVAEGPDGPL